MRLAVLAIAALIAYPAHGQESLSIDPQRCWFAGESFTPGATARAGETVMECQPDFSWKSTTKNAGGCLLNGDISASGAIVSVGPADSSVKSVCQLDGTWERLEP